MTKISRRVGKKARISDNRYFYVMGKGWYVLTRAGASGPYPEKSEAVEFVNTVLAGKSSEYEDILVVQ